MKSKNLVLVQIITALTLIGCNSDDNGGSSVGAGANPSQSTGQTGSTGNNNTSGSPTGTGTGGQTTQSSTIFGDAFTVNRNFTTSGTFASRGTTTQLSNIKFNGSLKTDNTVGNISNNAYTYVISGKIGNDAFENDFTIYFSTLDPLLPNGRASFEDDNADGIKDARDANQVLRFSDLSPLPASVPPGTNQNFGSYQRFQNFSSSTPISSGNVSYAVTSSGTNRLTCLRTQDNQQRSGIFAFEELCFKFDNSNKIVGFRFRDSNAGGNGVVESLNVQTDGF